jgi:hypothetical protein
MHHNTKWTTDLTGFLVGDALLPNNSMMNNVLVVQIIKTFGSSAGGCVFLDLSSLSSDSAAEAAATAAEEAEPLPFIAILEL